MVEAGRFGSHKLKEFYGGKAMIEHDRVVTPKELECRKNFSPKVLAEAARLIDEAKQKFEKDGAVPVELVHAMMEADGIHTELLWPDGEGLLVRAIDASQWFHIHGKNIYIAKTTSG
jgi:hypothetical protein